MIVCSDREYNISEFLVNYYRPTDRPTDQSTVMMLHREETLPIDRCQNVNITVTKIG